MTKVVFLDRDGTINVDHGYVYKIKDFELFEGTIEALKILSNLGYKLIIVTNQSGIGRGYYSEEDFEVLTDHMLKEFQKEGIIISKVYHCPHISEDNCLCRKPKIGLFEKAIKEFDIDLENSYVIGDRKRDLALCLSTNITGILITDTEDKEFVCKKNLLEAALYIKGVE